VRGVEGVFVPEIGADEEDDDDIDEDVERSGGGASGGSACETEVMEREAPDSQGGGGRVGAGAEKITTEECDGGSYGFIGRM